MNLSRFISGLRPALRRNHCLSPPSAFSNTRLETTASFHNAVAQHRRLSSKPPKIDKSRVPELRDEDIEEKFIRGWGPGGQSVNKTSSAVYLRHIPTGITVKCQKYRGQHQNRKEARLLLQEKWDEVLNGEDSVVAQKRRLLEAKSTRRASKAKKRRQLQAEWRLSLNNDVATDEVQTVSLDRDKDCTDKS